MFKKSLLLMLLMAFMAPWAANAQDPVTVYNGTETNSFIPFYSLYADYGTRAQFIIPAGQLEDLEGANITKLAFYAGIASQTYDQEFTVYMKEVDYTVFESATLEDWSSMTAVYVGTIAIDADKVMEIDFSDTPYTYEGGNLMIGFQVTSWGAACPSMSWYGVNQASGTYTAAYNYANGSHVWNSTITRVNFLPKTTFTYTPSSNYCAKPTNLHIVGEVGPRSVTVGWDAESGEVFEYAMVQGHGIDLTTVTTFDGTTSSNEMSWSTLIPDSDYTVVLRKVCGTDNYSQAIALEFHTTVACPAPNGLEANNVTATSASISWTGFSDSYILQYINPETATISGYIDETVTVLSEGFEGGSWTNLTNAGWSRTGSYWNVGSGTGHSSYTGSANGSYNATCYINTGSSTKDILITPSMDLSTATSATLSFNFRNVAWGSDIDEFHVYYRVNNGSWNEIYSNLSAQATWTTTPITVTLTGLANNYQIGFECKTGSGSWNYGYGLGIDDVEVVAEMSIPQYVWNTASSNATSPYVLGSLSPETEYQVRVIGVCDGEQSAPSEVLSFTTEPSCLAPTELTAGAPTAHAVTLGWTEAGTANNWVLQYGTDVDFTAGTYTQITTGFTVEGTNVTANVSGLDGETTYYARVKADCGNNDESDWSNTEDFTTLVACPAPTSLTVDESTITTTTATLSWMENGSATAWQICLNGDEDNPIDVEASELVEGSYTLNGLTAANEYTVKVRANCGGEDGTSAWSNEISFTTACEARTIDGDNSYTVSLKASTIADCWSQTSGTYQWSFNSTNGATFSTSSYSLQTSTKLLTPLFTLGEGDYWLSFTGKLYGGYDWQDYDYYTATLKVYYRTSTSEWQQLEDQNYSATYQTMNLDPSEIVLPEGTCQLAFEATTDYYSSYAYAYLYGMTIEKAPSCLKPTDLEAISVGYTALMTWESQVGAYEIAHATDATANPDENIEGTATDEEFEMDNLALGDHYFWVRANCGSDDGNSDWAGPESVHIGYCVPSPTSRDGKGITKVNFGVGEYIVNNVDETNGLPSTSPYYGDYTSMVGAMQAGVESTISITYATGSSTVYSYGTIIWVDWDNSLSFEDSEIVYTGTSAQGSNGVPQVLEASFTVPTTQAIGEYRMRIAGADSYFDSYISGTTTANHSACFTSTYAVCHDYTLRVLEMPSCMAAGNVTVALEDITSTSAVIRWTNNNGDEATYTVMQGETVLTTTAVDSYTLTGLTASTTYPAGTYTIIANCDETAVASVPEFATQCDVITVDAANVYFEDFSSWMPLCWELGDEVSAGYSGTNNWKKDSNSAYSGYYGTIDLYMPTMNINADNAVLTFKSKENALHFYTGGSSDAGGLNIVKISTDNGSTWTQLWCPTIDELTESYRTVTISLQSYVNQDILIAFEYQGNDAHGWHIDDVLVAVPFTKEITAYNETEEKGWYLIASPLAGETNPTAVTNLIDETPANYALFGFDQNESDEWRNYKAHSSNFVLESGKGYLYANNTGNDLTFTGVPYSGEGDVTLSLTEGAEFAGWNLVGNPFAEDAYIEKSFYRMNDDRTDLITEPTTGAIHAMEGVFVIADEDGQTLTFTTSEPSKGANLTLNVGRNRGNVIDRAIVNFGEGGTLPKFQLFENSTKVYIPQDNKDYAVVNAEAAGEMPINFKAENNGTYSLSFNAEEVSFSYLHLIDNMTGNDIDLLQTPSYTFNATTTDYESRFKLVFCTGVNDNSDSFAFCSNGNWIISNEGEATLQVIDVTGRILSSETVNGSVSKSINAAPGVYMIRLINGENVKVQKVVIE